MNPTHWTASDWSLVVNGAAALFVAYQANETRRAVRTSKDQGAEAIRARIDANTPAISVLSTGVPEWPPLHPREQLSEPQRRYETAPEARPLDLNQNGGDPLEVAVMLTIANDSAQHVKVRTDPSGELRPPPGEETWWLLAPESSETMLLSSRRSVAEWVDGYQQALVGKPLTIRGALVYEAPWDSGVTDRWPVVLTGSPMAPAEGQPDRWTIYSWPQLIGVNPPMVVTVEPAERTYYVSRSGRCLV